MKNYAQHSLTRGNTTVANSAPSQGQFTAKRGGTSFLALLKSCCLMAALLFWSTAALAQWSQLGADIDGEATQDFTGRAVSLSSDGAIVAIGESSNDGINVNAGQVRVYQLSGGAWLQMGADIEGEAEEDNSGSAVSLSSDGTTVAIGAPANDGNGSYSGQVRVYQFSGGAWTQLGADIDGEAADDQSGYSVSLSADGTTVAIGAIYSDGNSLDAGHVRVYQFSGGAWTQLGADLNGEASEDEFGYSVSLSSDGTRMAVGARFNDGNGSNSGHVRVYQFSGGAWTQLGADLDGEAIDDQSGYSVSLSSDGNRVAIGAAFNGGNGSSSGHVRVYQFSGGTWSQLGADMDGEAADDQSGYSVSLSAEGNKVAIGAPYNADAGFLAGHVRVYQFSIGTWTQLGADMDAEDAFNFSGHSVSLSADGNKVAIGAPINSNSNGDNTGQVRVYGFSPPILPGEALSFDGIPSGNQRVNVANHPSLDFTNAFTLETWVNLSEYPSGVVNLIRNYGTGFGTGGYHFAIQGTKLWFFLSDNSVFINTLSSADVPLNTWCHVAAVFNGISTQLYLNGALVGGSTFSPFALVNVGSPVKIGGNISGSINALKGSLDEVRLWNRNLQACEISNGMNCELGSGQTGLQAYFQCNQGIAEGDNSAITSLTDASGNGFDGTFVNFPLTGSEANFIAPGGVVPGSSCATLEFPTSFTVTGGGTYCTGVPGGGPGVPIGLDGSEVGTDYQLAGSDGIGIGSIVPGTGGAISFEPQTGVGTYYVVATPSAGGCTASMTGNAPIVESNMGMGTTNATACEGYNTTCISDDTYTADVEVAWSVKPASGTLSLSNPNIVGTPPSVDVSETGEFGYTFTGVTFQANGQLSNLVATFSEGCSITGYGSVQASSCNTITYSDMTVSGMEGTCGAFLNGTYTFLGFNGSPVWFSEYAGIIWTGSNWTMLLFGSLPVAHSDAGTADMAPCTGWVLDFDFGDCNGVAPTLSGGCDTPPNITYPPASVTGISIANMGACESQSTSDPLDDSFQSDVTVTFAYAPLSGDLTLKRGSIVVATKSSADLACVTSWIFEDVDMSADGADIILTAEFSPAATLTSPSLGTAPAACSCTPVAWYTDTDGDTYGNAASSVMECEQPTGYVANSTDCNDANAAVNPGATEICNGVDDDCDGSTDEGVQSTFYADTDNDSYGNAASSVQACAAPSGYVANSTDCNDANAAVNPGATEICNGVDDNCDGSTDEGVQSVFYADADGDGFGNAASSISACTVPSGYVANSTDCNDANAAVNPGATEICNGTDDDCDGSTDEGVQSVFYADADGNGFGNAASSISACTAPSGYVANSTDCNDNNAAVNPGATETCNGTDDDCDGLIDTADPNYTDNVNPTISCPANLNVTANSGCSATGVSLGTPVTSDNCGVASVTNNAPTIFPAGTTTVIWTVTDGKGNSATCNQTVTVTGGCCGTGADLIVQTASAPTIANKGEKMYIDGVVKNIGTVQANKKTMIRWYLSNDNLLDAGDYSDNSWKYEIKKLQPNETEAFDKTVDLPNNNTYCGAKFLIFKTDADDEVTEACEINNLFVQPITISCTNAYKADLVIEIPTAPATISAGVNFPVTYKVRNIGGKKAVASDAKFYLSTNATYEASDVFLDGIDTHVLDLNQSDPDSKNIQVSNTTAPGSYYLLFVADANNVINPEEPTTGGETNNVLALPVTVTNCNADMIVKDEQSPNNAAPGATISVSAKVKNTGNYVAGASVLNFYLSNNNSLGNDVLLGSVATPSLAPNVTSGVLSASVIIPANTPTGQRWIFFVADGDGQICETNENNNDERRNITIGGSGLIAPPSDDDAPVVAAGEEIHAPATTISPNPAGKEVATHELTIFPNPAGEEVTFQVDGFEGKSVELTVFDLLGRAVWQQTLTEGQRQVTLDVSANLPGSGVYLVRVGNGSGAVTQRLVVSE